MRGAPRDPAPRDPYGRRPLGAIRGVFVAALLLGFALGCRETSDAAPDQRGHGPLLSPYEEITHCSLAHYSGAETPLYSNRPYHTRERVEAVVGLAFCLGERHGTAVWIVEVARATEFFAFGHAALGLEDRGWEPHAGPVLVEAAGQAFDRVYSRRVDPGRYVVRQGFSRSAALVFWDDSAVAVVR